MSPDASRIKHFGRGRHDRLQKVLLLVLLCVTLLMFSGCSVFVATPKTTRVKVTGLDNQVNEYIIVANDLDESDLDIRLTNRYALRLDFQWLWNDRFSPIEMDPHLMNNSLDSQPTPWITCKYRF